MNPAVLLVEDLENDVFLVKRSWKIEAVPAALHVVMDGKAAVSYLAGDGEFADRKIHPFPCLVLLDLKLPRLRGLDVLAWIRSQESCKTLPVLVLTSSALQSDVDQAYQLGANAFLVKPSDIHELDNLVRLIRDFWLRANHFPRMNADIAEAGMAVH
ncbi:MAG TPA: response regulator [Verrucomicrobiae bacterium]|nr:response regulator [Verrucomicrobiae bacterium]